MYSKQKLFSSALAVISVSALLLSLWTLHLCRQTTAVSVSPSLSEHSSSVADTSNTSVIAVVDSPAEAFVLTLAAKIANREIIEDSYLCSIEDEQLLADIQTYNKNTSLLYLSFTGDAAGVIISLLELKDNSGEPLSTGSLNMITIPLEYRQMIAKIAHYSLYRNPEQLIHNDPALAQIITGETGGSYGVWPYHIQEGASLPSSLESLDAYFDLTDSIIGRLQQF